MKVIVKRESENSGKSSHNSRPQLMKNTMSHQGDGTGNGFSFPNGAFGGGANGNGLPGFNTEDWIGSNLSRSSSCSSMDIAATLFSSLQSVERAAAGSVNNMSSLNAIMGNRSMDNTFNPNFNNGTFPGIGMGFVPQGPAALPPQGIHQQGNGGDVTLEDMHRFLQTKLFTGDQVGAQAPFAPANPTDQLSGLAAQFQQMQRQIEMQRHTEMENLILLQQQQQQANSSYLPGNTQNLLNEALGLQQQYNPVWTIRNGTRASQGSINTRVSTSDRPKENKMNLPPEITQDDDNNRGMDKVLFVPTKNPSRSSTSSDGETNSLKSDAFPRSVVTDSSVMDTGDFKRQRTNSSSSFEALLSAFGDDLAEFDKDTLPNKDAKEDSKSKSNATSKAPHMNHLHGIFGQEDDASSGGVSGSVTSSKEYEMRQAQVVRDMAARHFMSQAQLNPLVLELNSANGSRNLLMEASSSSGSSSCAIELAMQRLSTVLNENRYVEGSVESPPEDPCIELDLFLEKFGEEGEKAKDSMLHAIEETEASLTKIHAWDRSLGLRKCHNRTVVKTRRSRAQIKAFLTGVKPPKEPKQRRKKGKTC